MFLQLLFLNRKSIYVLLSAVVSGGCINKQQVNFLLYAGSSML